MQIEPQQLLNELEMVAPGISQRDILQQSSCFIFQNGMVLTYNDEICCSIKTCLDITGAVQAKSLLMLLRKLKEDTVEITPNDGELIIKGKAKKSGIVMENEILINLEEIEQPKEFGELSHLFSDGVELVSKSTSKDLSQVLTNCVHITPDYVEGCDNRQVCRYPMDTGITDDICIRRDALKAVVGIGMKEVTITENWAHFRSDAGLCISCRLIRDKYLPVGGFLKQDGEEIKFPRSLPDCIDKAEVFSSEDVDVNRVVVTLSKDRVNIKGRGVSGWYTESVKAAYSGPKVEFSIHPDFLRTLVDTGCLCSVSDKKIHVETDTFLFTAALVK